MEIGQKLRALRVAKGLSLQELSNHLNTSRGNLSMIELGKTKPTLESISRIAAALGYKVAVTFVLPEQVAAYKDDIYDEPISDRRFVPQNKE